MENLKCFEVKPFQELMNWILVTLYCQLKETAKALQGFIQDLLVAQIGWGGKKFVGHCCSVCVGMHEHTAHTC